MKETYVDMLKQEYLDRKQRRPQYSVRAFARDLDLSSGFISLLFSGKRSLSFRTSAKILKQLNWEDLKVNKFMESVQESLMQSGSACREKREIIPEFSLELENLRLIKNLHHFAVLELIQNSKMESIEEISNRLNLPIIDTELIVKRLLRLKMINFDGLTYKASTKNRKIKSIPSQAIRQYHRHALELAQKSIEGQEFSKRDLRSLTLSIDGKKIPQAKKTLENFFRSFNKKYGNQINGEVYQLNMQLFYHTVPGERE